MIGWKNVLGLVFFALVASSTSQAASVIYLEDIDGTPIELGGGPNKEQISVSCTLAGDCINGFLGSPATLSTTKGTGYSLNENPDGELAFLNNLLADIGESSVTFVNKPGDGENNSFTTDRQYFSVKKQTWTAFFVNLSGGSVTVNFDPENFSHYTEYGELAAVPIPAAAWMFGSVLLGAGVMAKRRRKS